MFDSGPDDPAVFTAFAGFLLVLAFYAVSWWLTGRDPEPAADCDGQSTPPRNLPPAVMRFLHRMTADTQAAASALMSLAAQGLVVIEWEDARIRLRKAERPDASPTPSEAALAHHLLYTRSTLVLHNTAYRVVAHALKRFRRKLAMEHGRAAFKENRGWMLAGMALSLLVLGTVAAQSGKPVPFLVLSVLAIAAVVGTAALMQAVLPQRYIFPEPLNRGLRAMLRRAVEAGFIVVISPLAFIALADMIAEPPVPLTAVALMAALAGLHVLVYHLIKAPTVRGAWLRQEIDRFRSTLAETAGRGDALPMPAGIYAYALDLPEGAGRWGSPPPWLRVTEAGSAPGSFQDLGEALSRALDAAAMPPAKILLSGPSGEREAVPPAAAQ